MDIHGTYKNGQRKTSYLDGILTYYYANGTVKASGPFCDDVMDGQWKFYRDDGSLWQIGHLKANVKHGRWIRYDREGTIEFDKTFENGKMVSS